MKCSLATEQGIEIPMTPKVLDETNNNNKIKKIRRVFIFLHQKHGNSFTVKGQQTLVLPGREEDSRRQCILQQIQSENRNYSSSYDYLICHQGASNAQIKSLLTNEKDLVDPVELENLLKDHQAHPEQLNQHQKGKRTDNLIQRSPYLCPVNSNVEFLVCSTYASISKFDL